MRPPVGAKVTISGDPVAPGIALPSPRAPGPRDDRLAPRTDDAPLPRPLRDAHSCQMDAPDNRRRPLRAPVGCGVTPAEDRGRGLLSATPQLDGPLRSGKLPGALLDVLLSGLGQSPSEIRLGPRVGEDACAISVQAGILVAATDPITLTSAAVARSAVIVNANDVAVMGVRPRWFLATVLLPPGSTGAEVRELFVSMHTTLAEVGATLVGGHTEITTAVTRPVVVGEMIGLAEDGRYLATGGARPGEAIVQIGRVPVEGATVLATEASALLAALDPVVRTAAEEAIEDPGISVVEAALAAAALGATSLHDLTEGGLVGGLHELAAAAGVSVRLNTEEILWFPPGVEVCLALGLDPMATLASGALIATFAADVASAAVASLVELGHVAALIGGTGPGGGVHDMSGSALACPERDEVARILG
jgi:hydrogenase expression/formation protein HypE